MPPASAKAAQPSAKSSKQSAAPVSAVAAGVLLSSRIAAEAAAAATFGTNWAVVLPSGYPTTIDAAIAAVECEADALRHALGPAAERTSAQEAALRRGVALAGCGGRSGTGAAAAVTRRVA